MKKITSILILLSCTSAFAALSDAYSLVQISQGTWRVQCQNQRVFQVSTRDILNDQVCGTRTYDPQECFNATVNGMNSFEYDTLTEAQEIKQACSQGDFTTLSRLQLKHVPLGRVQFVEHHRHGVVV